MGKAEKRGNLIDYLKSMDSQTQENYGIARIQQAGAPSQRSYSIGTANNDYDRSSRLLSIFGGVMLGALGYNKVGTDQLTAGGIVDTGDYNASRLTINNNSAYTLKVLLPIYKAGQQVWISALIGQTWTIQNTSGNGDETTGNIELLGAADYTMTSNDWICFMYDANDEKFHQVSAGINDVGSGGGSGEVFTWTNIHNSGGYNLEMVGGNITFGTSGATVMNASNTLWLQTVNSTEVFRISSGLFQVNTNFYPKTNTTYTLGTSSKYWLMAYLENITMGNTNGDIDNVGHITQRVNKRHYFASGGNYIWQNSANGDLEYITNSTSVGHNFYIGATVLTMDKNSIRIRLPLDMTNNNIQEVNYIQSDSSVGFTENFINMGSVGNGMDLTSPTDVTLDGGGSIMTITSNGIDFAKKARPFLSALNIDLGDSTHEWNDAFFQGDVTFSTGGTVDFYDNYSSTLSTGFATALPANPTAYFTVKFRGATRYIPYYSA